MTIRLIIILHSALLDAALPSSLPHLLTPSPSLPLADSLSLSLSHSHTLTLSQFYLSLSQHFGLTFRHRNIINPTKHLPTFSKVS